MISVAWSPDSQQVASGDRQGIIHLWRPDTGKLQGQFHLHARQAMRVTWAPDSRTIASAGLDEEWVYQWEALSGTILQRYRIIGGDNACVAWSPDGTLLAASGCGSPFIWHVPDARLVIQLPEREFGPTALAWSATGDQLAVSCGNTISVYETGSWNLLWETSAQTLITDLASAPNGAWLASSGFDMTVQVHESQTGDLRLLYRGHAPDLFSKRSDDLRQEQIMQHPPVVWSLAWSPDSRSLASCSGDPWRDADATRPASFNQVQVWDALTGAHLLTYTGHTDQVRALSWSPDGRALASASLDQTVQIWSAPILFPERRPGPGES